MPTAVLETVVIFDEVLFKPGGQVHRWMTLLTTHFQEHAVAAAPDRSGELRAGIRATARPAGFKQMEGTIASLAPYSLYVLRGTGTPGAGGTIYSKKVWKAEGDTSVAYITLWGYEDPVTKKFSRRKIPGVRREQHTIGRKGYWMAFGPDEYGPRVIAHSVRGQEANNFLFEAWRATARTHPSLRGLAPNAAITDF